VESVKAECAQICVHIVHIELIAFAELQHTTPAVSERGENRPPDRNLHWTPKLPVRHFLVKLVRGWRNANHSPSPPPCSAPSEPALHHDGTSQGRANAEFSAKFRAPMAEAHLLFDGKELPYRIATQCPTASVYQSVLVGDANKSRRPKLLGFFFNSRFQHYSQARLIPVICCFLNLKLFMQVLRRLLPDLSLVIAGACIPSFANRWLFHQGHKVVCESISLGAVSNETRQTLPGSLCRQLRLLVDEVFISETSTAVS